MVEEEEDDDGGSSNGLEEDGDGCSSIGPYFRHRRLNLIGKTIFHVFGIILRVIVGAQGSQCGICRWLFSTAAHPMALGFSA